MAKKKDKLGKLRAESAMAGILVIIFLVSTVLMYFSMIQEEKKDNIIKSGNISALEASESFVKYLTTNISFIEFTSKTLEDMLLENKDDQEIQDFLDAQSYGIRTAAMNNTTGLYGYIRGRFFSGSGWVPDEGYDATTREWYLKPMENKGEITILEPYLDLQTKKYMLAVGKTLSDGESVISVDLSLESLQSMTEKTIKEKKADIGMILTDTGVVVTHSDTDELNKNYADETGTFGRELYDIIKNIKDHGHFEFNYGGRSYLVYEKELMNGWNGIMITDTTDTFNSFFIILGVTFIVVIAVVFIIVFIMGVSRRQWIVAEVSRAQLETKDTFLAQKATELRNTAKTLSQADNEKLNEIQASLTALADEMQKLSGRTADDRGKGIGRFSPL